MGWPLKPFHERKIHECFRFYRLGDQPALKSAIDDQFDLVKFNNPVRAQRRNKPSVKFFCRARIKIENTRQILRGIRFILRLSKKFCRLHQGANNTPDFRRVLLNLS